MTVFGCIRPARTACLIAPGMLEFIFEIGDFKFEISDREIRLVVG